MSSERVTTPLLLVQFHSSWCKGSAALATAIRDLAGSSAAGIDPTKVTLAFVDADLEQEILEEYGIAKYPLLKLFHLCERRDGLTTGMTVTPTYTLRPARFSCSKCLFSAYFSMRSYLQFEPESRDVESIAHFLIGQQDSIDNVCRSSPRLVTTHDEL